jgi:AcrR family transcriptional regulator
VTLSSDTRGRGVRLPRSARRAQVLEAAQEVFVECGYHAAAMDDIAERAGVSKPVLYQHFPGKLDLYLALFDQHSGELLELIRAAMASTTDNKERVEATMSAYFEFVDRPGAPFRLVFESDLTNEASVRERVDKVSQDSAEAIAEVIKEDTDLPDAEAHLLGMALSGMAHICARFWLSQGSSIPRDEAARLVSTLSWRGLGGFPKIEREASGSDAG